MVDVVLLVFTAFPYLPWGWMDPELASEDFLIFALWVCERGGPLQKCKTPNPPKVLGRVLVEVPARNGVLGKVLVLLVLF